MTDLSRAHGPGQVVSHRFYAMDVCGQRLGTLGHRRRIDDAVKSDLAVVGFNMNGVFPGQVITHQSGLDLGGQRRVAKLVFGGVIRMLYRIGGGARSGLRRDAAFVHFLTSGAFLCMQR